MTSPGAVELVGVTRYHRRGPVVEYALRDVSLSIGAGELVVVAGPSGSGKTTLLDVVGGIERADRGTVHVGGTDVAELEGADLTRFRSRRVGFVFQFFNLVPTLTARENVELIADLSGANTATRATEALRAVGLGDKADRFPAELSGGEQQRVAVARALVKDANVVLADEPTGSLDVENGRRVLGLLRRAVDDRGDTVIVVTHNRAIIDIADRVVELGEGRVRADRRQPSPLPVERLEW